MVRKLAIPRYSNAPAPQHSLTPTFRCPMKIGVVGCGALGSYYGAKLCRAGREVHFLLRSHYEVVRRKGVRIRSVEGDFHVNPKCARAPEEIGPCDLALIGLKTTANDQFPRLVSPLVGPNTAVMTLQNGLGNEARLATLFRHAGVPCNVTENLERAHWEKLVWNIPFNGLGVASAAGFDAVIHGRVRPDAPLGPCWPTNELLADPRWENLVRDLMLEVIAAANALGLKIEESVAEEQISRTRTMGAYKASTLLDFERRHPLELESMFLEPLRRAQKAGVAVPRLAALGEVLKRLDPG